MFSACQELLDLAIKKNMSIKFYSMLKLSNNRTQAQINGHNQNRFYSSARYNGTCLFVVQESNQSHSGPNKWTQ